MARKTKAPLLEQLSRAYPGLTAPQKRVAEYILKHPEKVREASVEAVCRATATSEPVLFAVCRAAGRGGYRELKLDLAGELAVLRERRRAAGGILEEGGPDVELGGDDRPEAVFRKIGAVYLESIESAVDRLDPAAFARAAELLAGAGRVAVFGMGTSGHVARLGQYALLRAGEAESFAALCAKMDEQAEHIRSIFTRLIDEPAQGLTESCQD